jgi:hypothetical protein
MTVKILQSHEIIEGKVWLQLIETVNGFDDFCFAVRVSDGDKDFEDTEFPDQFQALAHLRDVASRLGKPIPYQAPVFAEPLSVDPADEGVKAVDLLYQYANWFKAEIPGSPGCDAVERHALVNPDFIRLSSEIVPQGPAWVWATLRRICHHHSLKQAKVYEEMSRFGAF